MQNKGLFTNLSPLDHRYYIANKELFERLSLYLSEEANIHFCIKAELALLRCLINHIDGINNKKNLLRIVETLPEKISPEEVYLEEAKTHHNIRALVNVIKRKLPDEIKNLVHLGATSVDILDTSFALRIKNAVRKVILPELIGLEKKLIHVTIEEAETPQVGRTHGQHAVPVTFGFAMAEYVSRLGKSIIRLEKSSKELCGKLAGAVGSYNAMSLIVKEPEKLEKEYLTYLGLSPSEHSTQLVEPEYLLQVLLEINTAFGIIANAADDLRNLQRTEINEVREVFTGSQVGSSTMPQKRNPWNSEHVKSLWKAFSPRVLTFFMDQISEHQRDLTNSASQRFITEYLSGFAAAVARLSKVVSSLMINRKQMMKNLKSTGDMVLAEAFYILLSLAGEPEGHERVRKLTLEAEKQKKKLVEMVQEDKELWGKVKNQFTKIFSIKPEDFFSHPEKYTGLASVRAKSIAEKYDKVVTYISVVLTGM